MRWLQTLVAALVMAVALTGCTAENSPGGQSVSGGGALAYNGAQTGSHNDEFQCDGSGVVSYGANLGSGSVQITVRDGGRAQVYSESVSGTGQKSGTDSVSGASGQWTLTATRSSSGMFGGGFSGQYTVDVDC